MINYVQAPVWSSFNGNCRCGRSVERRGVICFDTIDPLKLQRFRVYASLEVTAFSASHFTKEGKTEMMEGVREGKRRGRKRGLEGGRGERKRGEAKGERWGEN